MKAKIYCEVTCAKCRALAAASGYYRNENTIKKLKEVTANWEWDEENGGNFCPGCKRTALEALEESDRRHK